ncbi:MAG: hypothetical protein GC180_04285 [Bacteroidetes bacterium]|nr:hypothetical protein [Bacteroidota bacterium]
MYARTDKPVILKSWHKLILVSLLWWACNSKNKGPVHAFYHWKTTFTLGPSDYQKLDSMEVSRLYVRYFDIDKYGDKLKPLGVIEWKSLPASKLDIVPCVFITNRALQFIPDTAIQSLALHVYSKIQKLNAQLNRPVKEIQMDCDWSPETKSKYFSFLETLKVLCRQENWLLSATIRLHQIKFPQTTGIPPVDRGMLMYYNMGDLKSPNETNSILNLETAAQYTSKLPEYPLELDLALPLFSWVVQFRNDELLALRSAWNKEDLQNDTLFVHQQKNWYQARTNGLFKGEYILKNDRFRVEEIQPDLVKQAINHLYSLWKTNPVNLSLFHYNPYEIETYSCRNIEEIYRAASQ